MDRDKFGSTFETQLLDELTYFSDFLRPPIVTTGVRYTRSLNSSKRSSSLFKLSSPEGKMEGKEHPFQTQLLISVTDAYSPKDPSPCT